MMYGYAALRAANRTYVWPRRQESGLISNKPFLFIYLRTLPVASRLLGNDDSTYPDN